MACLHVICRFLGLAPWWNTPPYGRAALIVILDCLSPSDLIPQPCLCVLIDPWERDLKSLSAYILGKEGWKSLSAVSSTDLKRIQTSTQFIQGFRADESFAAHWSGGKVLVCVQDRAPSGHLAITPKGFSKRQSKVLTAKSMVELLGQRSGTAQFGRVGRASTSK